MPGESVKGDKQAKREQMEEYAKQEPVPKDTSQSVLPLSGDSPTPPEGLNQEQQ